MAGSIHMFGCTKMVDTAVMIHQMLAKDRLPSRRGRLLRSKLAGDMACWAAAAILLIFSGMALWPEGVAPYNAQSGRLADRHKPTGYVVATGGVHWLGTDHQGRDVWWPFTSCVAGWSLRKWAVGRRWRSVSRNR
jgi:ABC-type dipeptide/oligopeptide/nickel transport system permease subunit